MKKLEELFCEMINYDESDPTRIQHFTKVHAYAALIGKLEQLDEKQQEILEAAAYVHDIGIREAEKKFGSCSGKLQEQEGPALAEVMLARVGFEPAVIDRVSYLVGHHHTYTDIDGMDYQILVEADFLVNLFENHSSVESIQKTCDKIFVTQSGKEICRTMFGLKEA